MVTNAKNPGPGAYTHGMSQGGPAYSMGAKVSDNVDSWQPGPGKYQPDMSSIKGDPKSGKFGGGNRSNIAQGKHGPGPGAYNTNYRNTDAIGYSIGEGQRSRTRDHGNPGPG